MSSKTSRVDYLKQQSMRYKEQIKLVDEKIARFRKDYTLETDPEKKDRLKQLIIEEEEEFDRLTDKVEEIESSIDIHLMSADFMNKGLNDEEVSKLENDINYEFELRRQIFSLRKEFKQVKGNYDQSDKNDPRIHQEYQYKFTFIANRLADYRKNMVAHYQKFAKSDANRH